MPPRTSPKKDAILAIGLDKPTAEIVTAAKGRGIEVSATYVDVLKQASGKKAKKPAKAPTKALPKNVPRRRRPKQRRRPRPPRRRPRRKTPPK